MANSDRKIEIVNRLSEDRVTTVEELAAQFFVTPSTIRRDLLSLEEQGVVKRTHGGALLNKTIATYNYLYKSNHFSKQKEAIAKLAASLIKDDDVVALNTSTITDRIAKYITAKNVTVFTNSLEVINTLKDKKDIVLMDMGGMYYNVHHSFEGNLTNDAFSRFNYRISFIGANGLDEKYGITTKTEIEAFTKQTIINNSIVSVVVAESEKFGKTFKNRVFPLDKVSYIITDDKISKDQLEEFKNKYKILIAS